MACAHVRPLWVRDCTAQPSVHARALVLVPGEGCTAQCLHMCMRKTHVINACLTHAWNWSLPRLRKVRIRASLDTRFGALRRSPGKERQQLAPPPPHPDDAWPEWDHGLRGGWATCPALTGMYGVAAAGGLPPLGGYRHPCSGGPSCLVLREHRLQDFSTPSAHAQTDRKSVV